MNATDIDFAAIMADRLADEIDGEPIHDIYTEVGQAVYALAAKVPALCPESGSHDGHNPPASCSLCPTIGQMLAEWAPLRALAFYGDHTLECVHWEEFDGCTCGLDEARAALESARS